MEIEYRESFVMPHASFLASITSQTSTLFFAKQHQNDSKHPARQPPQERIQVRKPSPMRHAFFCFFFGATVASSTSWAFSFTASVPSSPPEEIESYGVDTKNTARYYGTTNLLAFFDAEEERSNMFE